MSPGIALSGVLCMPPAGAASAGPEKFLPGTQIEGSGRYAPAEGPASCAGPRFKIAYDVSAAAEKGQISRRTGSGARFPDRATAAGVPSGQVEPAILVHAGAHRDLQRL